MGYKEQITIGGVPGAGKTTVAKIIADKLGYKFYSMGLLRREIAVERFGITIDELNLLEEKKLELNSIKTSLEDFIETEIDKRYHETFRELLSVDTDYLVDDKQRELGSNKEHFVVDGRLAWYFCKDSVKFYLDCDYHEAARRIYNDPRNSEKTAIDQKEVYDSLVSRMESDKMRYQKKYGRGVNCYDKRHFNIIIDTTTLSIEETANLIMINYKNILDKRK